MSICDRCHQSFYQPIHFIKTDVMCTNYPELYINEYTICNDYYNKLEQFLKGEN